MTKLKKTPKSKKQSSVETPTLSLKEQLAQKRQTAKARQEFISILSSTIGCALFLGMIIFFVGGVKLAIPAVLGIIVITLSYKYPRPALFAFIIYLPLGGTIIYALGNSPLMQLAKDAFYIPALISIWQTYKKQNQPFIVPKSIKIPLLILLSCFYSFRTRRLSTHCHRRKSPTTRTYTNGRTNSDGNTYIYTDTYT